MKGLTMGEIGREAGWGVPMYGRVALPPSEPIEYDEV